MRADPWHRFVIWRDRRRRAGKLLHRVRTADVAVVSAGKSGRTWLRAMVSHLYHQRYGLPPAELINFDDFNARHGEIPRILFSGVKSELRAPSGRTWGEEMAGIDRIVLLSRDPRDVAVSFYFQLTERATERELLRKGIASREALRDMTICGFLLDPQLGVPAAHRFVEDWRAALSAHPSTMTVTYEELCADTVAAFGRVARFLDPATTDAEIAGAVAFGDFGAMQAREQQGFFNSERLRPGGSGAPEGLKVRRGKVGGYRDYLSAAEIAAVDRLVSVPAADAAADAACPATGSSSG